MTWNHRLVNDAGCITVREVFYDKNHRPWAHCEAEATSSLCDIKPAKSIRKQLRQMLRACDLPILESRSDFSGKAP